MPRETLKQYDIYCFGVTSDVKPALERAEKVEITVFKTSGTMMRPRGVECVFLRNGNCYAAGEGAEPGVCSRTNPSIIARDGSWVMSEIETLSGRETEVVNLVAKGLTNVAVANELGVSFESIRMHNKNIQGKLGAGNGIEAVLKSFALGLIDRDNIRKEVLERVGDLNEQEMEAMNVVTENFGEFSSNDKAAARLNMSAATLRDRIASSREKLGVKTKMEAALHYAAAQKNFVKGVFIPLS